MKKGLKRLSFLLAAALMLPGVLALATGCKDGKKISKEQDFIELCRAFRMGLLIHTAELMQMGNQAVKQIQAQRTGKNATDGHNKTPIAAVFQRRQDQADHCRRQQQDIDSFL